MKRTNLKLKRVLVLLSVFLLWGGVFTGCSNSSY